MVDKADNPIITQAEVYSGMYGRVNVTFFPYAFGGKKGVGCGLGPVQKLRDGEALGGSMPTAAQVFGAPQPQSQQPVQPQPMYSQPQQPTYSQPQINPITGMPY